jgi:CRP/FNR family transcriptional regulator
MDEKTKKKLVSFFEKHELRSFKNGEIIVKPGERFPGLVFLKSGYIKVYTVSKDGKEIVLQIFKPLFYFSLIYAITRSKNRYYFEAIGPVEMWVAPKKEAVKFIKTDCSMCSVLMKAILSAFLDLNVSVEQLISGNAYSKVANFIASAVGKHGAKEDSAVRIKFPVTHKMIAGMTGLTRETVTLQLLKMERQKIIDNKGKRITVIDFKKLHEAAVV